MQKLLTLREHLGSDNELQSTTFIIYRGWPGLVVSKTSSYKHTSYENKILHIEDTLISDYLDTYRYDYKYYI